MVLALALLHHLAITNNLPFGKIANFFSRVAHALIIEFVPKDDPQAEKLLVSRQDIFDNYTQDAFEDAFKRHFNIREVQLLPNSGRALYLLENRHDAG
jgi:hypothetical protein